MKGISTQTLQLYKTSKDTRYVGRNPEITNNSLVRYNYKRRKQMANENALDI